MNVLLTAGSPGVGKSTLIRAVCKRLVDDYGMDLDGFYTEEVRDPRTHGRLGFDVVTLDGQRGPLARVGLRSTARVGRYGVDLNALDTIGVAAVEHALQHKGHMAIIDEIGTMELYSKAFCDACVAALDAPSVPVLGTVTQRMTHPFVRSIHERKDTRIVAVTRGNRNALVEELTGWFTSPTTTTQDA